VSLEASVIVLGLGEVGRPLHQILSRKFRWTGVDIQPVEVREVGP